MLSTATIPGLLIAGTDTGVGKTLVAGAIADWFKRRGRRVAVSKPCATGCRYEREGLISEDAEFLAHCADTKHPLHVVCPQRYLEPLAPAVAAERAKMPLDWEEIERSIATMTRGADVLIVEGVGGILTPMDFSHTILDVAAWLGLPVVIVARAGLGTINHTLLTINAIRDRRLKIAGVVINRYPAETPGVAEETNPRAIERWGKTNVICVVPEAEEVKFGALAPDVIAAIGMVDWEGKL